MILKWKADSMEMKYTLMAMDRMSKDAGLAFVAGPNGKLDHLAIRKTMEAGYSHYPVAQGVTFEDSDICPVHMEISVPEKLTDTKNLMLYIHGGGFCCGSAKLSRGIASQLAADLGCKVYSVDYRLCPENLYPASVDDCYTAYQALVKKFPDANIAVMGESAGAMATLVVTLRALRDGIKAPSCIVPNSPVGTLELGFDRTKEGWHDNTVAIDAFDKFENYYYAPGTDVSHWDVSPLNGNFENFPVTVLTCSEHETLSVDAYLLHDKMEKAGVDVTLISVDGAFHAFGASGRGTPESSKVLDFAEEKIKESFKK